jgi:hypothetical protein
MLQGPWHARADDFGYRVHKSEPGEKSLQRPCRAAGCRPHPLPSGGHPLTAPACFFGGRGRPRAGSELWLHAAGLHVAAL